MTCPFQILQSVSRKTGTTRHMASQWIVAAFCSRGLWGLMLAELVRAIHPGQQAPAAHGAMGLNVPE